MTTKPVFRIKGIVLHSIDFQEHDKILSLFTRDEGMVRMIVNGANRPSKGMPLTTPLTVAEFVCTPSRGELLRCVEVTPLETHPALRGTLPLLEASCSMLKAISTSQLPGKASPLLFDLLSIYLRELPRVADPYILATSFKLKLLRHDGLLHLCDRCSACKTPAAPLHLAAGETFCSLHSPSYAERFDDEDALMIKVLLLSRQFEFMATLELPSQLKEKLDRLFLDRIEQQ